MKNLLHFTLASFICMTVPHLEAKLVTKAVAYEHNGVQLEGYLAYDDEKSGKVPGILLIHEWWGLNDYAKSRANQLAELGYVAFAADMYGKNVATEDAKKAGELASPFYGKALMAERAQAGLDQLMKVENVDTAKLAAIGFCFGGATVESLAYTGAPLRGIVSFHGGPVPPPADGAGKVKAKFLLLNGAVDPMLTAKDRAEFEEALEAAKIDYQSIDYAGALHAFTNPDADKMAAKNNLIGKIGYHETAARRSWQQMQVFFNEIFK